MFNWNDKELTDIIWGETGESDDHIVPHPDGSEGKAPSYGDNIKKEWAVEASNIKPTDQKKSTTKTDLSNIKLDGSSKHDSGGASITAGCRMELGADLSLTNATKSNQYSLGAEASNNLTEVPKHECLRDEGNRLGDDSRVLHHQNEELEQGDFIDYGWANIGSFDDLDKIFSNNNPLFGDTSLPNTLDLWSSCKDVTSSPDKSIPLSIDSPRLALGSPGSPSKRLKVKTEYRLDREKSSTADEENVNDITFNVPLCTDARDHGGGKSMLLPKQKELCGSLSPHLNKFGMPSVTNQPCPASDLSQQSQLQGPECLQHKHFPGPFFASSIYGDTGNSNHFNKSQDASSKSLMMTPQEKIEKLRRRQQLRAMLAIQKQQQQFSYQTAKEGGSLEENLSCIPSLDPSSPLEQGDSNTACLAVENSSVEDTAVYLLQDVISKLDLKIRLCIRDSLFRLARSATQRQCGNDSCSTKKGGREVSKKEINTNNRPPYVETQTNPIDRTVAHLLFHNPSELPSTLAEFPKLSMFSMLNCERKAIGSPSFPDRFLQENSETNSTTAHQGPNASASDNEVDIMKSSPCIECFENASNNEGADASVIGVEAAS
ncbi:protein LNK2 isoform X10 [Capsicum annuum]|uniref:protein LNK2 isoform X10 n=1 Tax=Capsicum annuum TaxID=4072 RepID=UPI001FB144C8|nr:protein LNK2 isoform X10 [Capsicum annuum]